MLRRTIDENAQKIKDVLLGTGRVGVEHLIKHMENEGFFTAPCSGAYHLCEEGGLAEHSVNVYEAAIALGALYCPQTEQLSDFMDSIAIAAVLHDLGKMGDHHKPNYIPNVLKSGELSKAKPYETNKELNYEEHEIRSVIIAERYIELTEDEETAILHHNGLWGKLDSSFSSYYDKHLLAFIIHTADLYCSRFLEVE